MPVLYWTSHHQSWGSKRLSGLMVAPPPPSGLMVALSRGLMLVTTGVEDLM